MKSQEAWDFAQSYSADLLGNTGAIMGIIGILIGFLNFKESTLNVVLALIFMLLFMFYPVYKTEQKLKSKFK
jgi:multisubunit Na+/H+ antiporter MnhG subunit